MSPFDRLSSPDILGAAYLDGEEFRYREPLRGWDLPIFGAVKSTMYAREAAGQSTTVPIESKFMVDDATIYVFMTGRYALAAAVVPRSPVIKSIQRMLRTSLLATIRGVAKGANDDHA